MMKAVVFDMDGVLIDSEIVYLTNMWERIKKDYPAVLLADLYPTVGMDGKRCVQFMLDLLKLEDDEAGREQVIGYFSGLPVSYKEIMRPEVPLLLTALQKRGIRIGLASSSSRSNIMQVLRECGLTDKFEYVISGEEFSESKPNPEIYLNAIAGLGYSAEECLAVEDSTYGIQAGKAAGLKVVALKDTRFGFQQELADGLVENLMDILPFVDGDGKEA